MQTTCLRTVGLALLFSVCHAANDAECASAESEEQLAMERLDETEAAMLDVRLLQAKLSPSSRSVRSDTNSAAVSAAASGSAVSIDRAEQGLRGALGHDEEDEDASDSRALESSENHTALLETFKKYAAEVEVNRSRASKYYSNPEPIYYSSGVSYENYCPAGQRYTLFGGSHLTADLCYLASCNSMFNGGNCGPYFYTAAVPGNDMSYGVCRCCTHYSPTFYKSGVGNKVYTCR